MAKDFSSQYIEQSKKNLQYTPLYFKIRLARFITKWRELLRFLFCYKKFSSSVRQTFTSNFEQGGAHFQKNRWVFIENIVPENFYRELLRNWPPRHYFSPPNQLAKSYDAGFHWAYGREPNFKESDPYDRCLIILDLLNYFRSDDFLARVKEFTGRGGDFVCYLFSLNRTHTGSEVFPHKDSFKEEDPGADFFNITLFVDGTGGKNSGGLTLSRDNEMKDIIFEPVNLKNTALIYDTRANFYHGFRPVAKGKFRLAMNIQFCEKSYVEN